MRREPTERDARHLPAAPQRILVVGPAGAGKSTFSRVLAERTRLPLVHLDAHHWRAGWVELAADAVGAGAEPQP